MSRCDTHAHTHTTQNNMYRCDKNFLMLRLNIFRYNIQYQGIYIIFSHDQVINNRKSVAFRQ